MNEITLQYIESSKILMLSLFSLLYGLGGVRGKWKRRILASLYLTLLVIVYSLINKSFSWFYLLFAPYLFGAFSTGYGADNTKEKVTKRLRYGVLVGVASIVVAFPNQAWLIFSLHMFLCCLISVIFGVNNPISARGEETVIATTAGFLPLFMI